MKKKGKIIILMLIIIAIILVGIIYLWARPKEEEISGTNVEEIEQQNKVVEEFVQEMEDGSKLNTSTKLNQTKNVDGLEIGDIQLLMVGGETILTANVKNNKGIDLGVTAIDIILLDKDGGEIITIGGVIGDVKAGKTVKLEASTTLDFANAYDFKIVIK